MWEAHDEQSDSEALDSEDDVDMEDSETGEETASERGSEVRSETTSESESEMSEASAEESGTDDDSEAGGETLSESNGELEAGKVDEEECGDQHIHMRRDGDESVHPLDGKCSCLAFGRQATSAGKPYGREGDEVIAPETVPLASRLGAKAVWPEGAQTDEFVRCFWDSRGQSLGERRRWRVKRRQQCRLMRQWLKIDDSKEVQNFGHETQKVRSSGEGERLRSKSREGSKDQFTG